MSKNILLIGNAPLPTEKNTIVTAPGLRTHHLAIALRRAGHQVTICAISIGGNAPSGWTHDDSDQKFFRVHQNEFRMLAKIQKIHDKLKPDAIVTVNTDPSFFASQLRTTTPRWADLNGWKLAESQMHAEIIGSDAYLDIFLHRQRQILNWADKFSAVSERQRLANLGELAQIGRLRKKTNKWNFVTTIRNAREGDIAKETNFLHKKLGLSEKAKIIGRLGNIPPWEDHLTLARTIRETLAHNPDIHFVTTGGLAPNDKTSYGQFCRELHALPRVHFLGWLTTDELQKFIAALDIFILADRDCNETLFGARNRLLEIAAHGIPSICTTGTEIVAEMANFGALKIVPTGNPRAFTTTILDLLTNPKKQTEISKKAKEFIEKQANYDITTTELIKWAENPQKAPDRHRLPLFFTRLLTPIAYIREKGLQTWLRRLIFEITKK